MNTVQARVAAAALLAAASGSAAAQLDQLRITYSLGIEVGDDGNVPPIDSAFVSETVVGLRTASIEQSVAVPFSVPGDGPASASGRIGLDSFSFTSAGGDLALVDLNFSGTLTRDVSDGNGGLGDIARVIAGIDIENFTIVSAVGGSVGWTSSQRLQFNVSDAIAFYNQSVPLDIASVGIDPFIGVPVVEQSVYSDTYAWESTSSAPNPPSDLVAFRARGDLEDTLTFHPGDTTLGFAFTVQGVAVIPAPASAVLLGFAGLAAVRRRR